MYPIGMEVGCEYRHDDNGMPIRGIILSVDDPLAWKNTLQFPLNKFPEGPSQQEVAKYVDFLIKVNMLHDVPVLYGEMVGWDNANFLYPYELALQDWRIDRLLEAIAKCTLMGEAKNG